MLYILTASGTGGMEAAIVNTLSPGDRVLAVTVGVFGDRFAKIAEAYGAELCRPASPLRWAKPPIQTVSPPSCPKEGPFAAVSVHSERDLHRRHQRRRGALCQAIHVGRRSLASHPGGRHQRAGRHPPSGRCLGHATWSSAARKKPGWPLQAWPWSALAPGRKRPLSKARMPRFYLDLGQAAKKYAKRNQTPATPKRGGAVWATGEPAEHAGRRRRRYDCPPHVHRRLLPQGCARVGAGLVRRAGPLLQYRHSGHAAPKG
jgi:hypothetical protein